MDPAALSDANALVGNAPLAPGLEFTIAGPSFSRCARCGFAFLGTVHELRAGEQVKIGRFARGRARLRCRRGWPGAGIGDAGAAAGETT